MTVVDSSVVVDALLARVPIESVTGEPFDAPHLIDSEFLNVLRRMNRTGTLNDVQSSRLVGRFDQLRIGRHSVVSLHRRIWEWRHDLTAHDATYVALAESLDTRLLTTDVRLARAAGPRCEVVVV